MSNNVKFIDYQKSLSVKVGKYLLSKEFNLASNIGIALSYPIKTNELGILYNDPDVKQREYLFGLIALKPRRCFLGTLWFDNAVRNANNSNWVFEVYGRKHVKLVKLLAEEMASMFNVKIIVNLEHDQSKVEMFVNECNIL